MQRLNPRLRVTYLTGTTPDDLVVPRLCTLPHSDITGALFLSIGDQFNTRQISGLYTRSMRDEVLGELASDQEMLLFKVYCHVSGGFVLGTARWRYSIFRYELLLALEAIRYGDRTLFEQNPELDQTPVHVYFQSNDKRFKKSEHWGVIADYGHQYPAYSGGVKAGSSLNCLETIQQYPQSPSDFWQYFSQLFRRLRIPRGISVGIEFTP